MKNLTTEETSALEVCETVIERGLETFVEVGDALLQIRKDRLYRTQFKTFEQYCKKRWSMSRVHAKRLIAAVEVTKNIEPIGSVPASESVARPLTSLPPEKQRKVWASAVAASPTGKPTAKEVQREVSKIVPMPKPDQGDSDETCWRRGLLYRANASAASAAFEDWSNFTVDLELVKSAGRAAQEWQKTADYLGKLYEQQKQARSA